MVCWIHDGGREQSPEARNEFMQNCRLRLSPRDEIAGGQLQGKEKFKQGKIHKKG